jgi:SAM-dependent methyltransferase
MPWGPLCATDSEFNEKMFGPKIDYRILKPLAHGGNRATEEELNAGARRVPPFDEAAARARLERLLRRFEGHPRIEPETSCLDVGCGRGDLAAALALAGSRDVTGIDIVRRNIDAASRAAEDLGLTNRLRFVHGDVHAWEPGRRYDLVFSHEALEHIHDPGGFLADIGRLLSPEGRVVLAFGPLFHSPFGDHLWGFFKIQIPWRGVLFSEKALMRLRREFFRPTDPAPTFREIAGGLNRMRYSEFLNYMEAAGLRCEYLRVNAQLRRAPPLFAISELLRRIPVLRDYFTMSVYVIARRGEQGPPTDRPRGGC